MAKIPIIVGLEIGTAKVCVVVAEAPSDREEILMAEVDPQRIEDVRRNWPFLRDRRVDAYAGLDQRFLHNEKDC